MCVGQVLDTRPPYTDDPSSTIFVAIASYRDVRCNETLASLFDGAAFPDRISVCAQHSRATRSMHHMPSNIAYRTLAVNARTRTHAMAHVGLAQHIKCVVC